MHIVVMKPLIFRHKVVTRKISSVKVLHDQKAVDEERLRQVDGHHEFVARSELFICRLVAWFETTLGPVWDERFEIIATGALRKVRNQVVGCILALYWSWSTDSCQAKLQNE